MVTPRNGLWSSDELLAMSRRASISSKELIASSRAILARGKEMAQRTVETRHNCEVIHAAYRQGNGVIKSCGCGRKYTLDSWRKAKFIGWQDGPLHGEMRNCECTSTLFFVVRRDAA